MALRKARAVIREPPPSVEADLRRLNWALTAYVRSSSALIHSTDVRQVMAGVCEAIVLEPAYPLAWVGLANPPPDTSLTIAAAAGTARSFLDGLTSSRSADSPEGQGPAGNAIRSGVPRVVADTLKDDAYAPWRVHLERFGIRATVAVPLKVKGQSVGVMVVYGAAPGVFGDAEIAVFTQLADELAFAVALDQDRQRLAASEAARSLSEARYQRLVEHAPMGIVTGDGDGRIGDVNLYLCRLLGVSSEDLVGRPWRDMIGPEAQSALDGIIEFVLGGGEFNGELPLRHADGTMLTVEVAAVDIPDGVMLATVRDVTESNRLKAERRAADERYRRLFESSLDGILISRYQHGILDANPSFCRLVGCEASDVIGKRILSLVHPDDVERIDAEGAALAPQTAVSAETRVRHRAGHYIPVEYTTWATAEGQFMTIIKDISERKIAEAAQRETLARLDRFSRVANLGEMAGTIAHEVNQPLAAVATNAEAAQRWLAREPADLGEAKAALDRIVRDAHRATNVIQRTRVMLAHGAIELRAVDIGMAIAEVIVLMDADLRRADVTVSQVLVDDPLIVSGDRIQLQQVLINLIQNAVDAMRPVLGQPRLIAISACGDAEQVIVSVRDSGVGLAPDMDVVMFDPFYTTKAAGAGLGLGVCRSIVSAHGGRIWAESPPDGGAQFQFALPRSATGPTTEGRRR